MSEANLDRHHLGQWVGKSESAKDTLHAAQARLMQATLDQTPNLQTGAALPPLWHWAYFLTGLPMGALGRDGHAAKGEFLPPVPLPRRMWAGGRLTFHDAPKLGDTLTKTSTIKTVTVKEGRSGTLCFVTVEHVLTDQNDAPRVTEEQDLVFREDPAPDAPAPKPTAPPEGSVASRTITPSTVQLFRYSALTFNGHRIHYDRDYCRHVEGYPGIIVHGPLIATLLAGFAQEQAGKALKAFNFRAVSPLFDTAAFAIHTDGQGLVWAQTPEGNLAMKAEAVFED
ncbi:MAG: MaoC family dehydratase N-terminal domain-containing protein [Pseudomonadota bacterium]